MRDENDQDNSAVKLNGEMDEVERAALSIRYIDLRRPSRPGVTTEDVAQEF